MVFPETSYLNRGGILNDDKYEKKNASRGFLQDKINKDFVPLGCFVKTTPVEYFPSLSLCKFISDNGK